MKYCQNCGRQVREKQDVCLNCGKRLNVDTGDSSWGLLGFFIPIVGLILYIVWNEDKPRTAKMAGKGALTAVALSIMLFTIFFIIQISSRL